ncbi:MAG: hypothetical protein PHS97_07600 [Oscillospiraceae bacterium]|nr:hypothetical protein [Oscillospiraceae bacterium]
MKKLITALLCTTMIVSLCSCSQTDSTVQAAVSAPNQAAQDTLPAPVQSPPDTTAEAAPEAPPLTDAPAIVAPSEAALPDTLHLYKSLEFGVDETGDCVELYTSAATDADGEWMWDDSNLFFVQAIVGGQHYVLLETQNVQLGMPTVSVFYDRADALHIILTDARTAQFRISEFTYSPDAGGFEKAELADYAAVNYWGMA